MRKKIFVELILILYFIAIIIPVIGISENKPNDFLKYINGDTSKDQSRYTKIYNNVFIFGIGHNQKDVDEKYKVGEKWIIEGEEFDLIGHRLSPPFLSKSISIDMRVKCLTLINIHDSFKCSFNSTIPKY